MLDLDIHWEKANPMPHPFKWEFQARNVWHFPQISAAVGSRTFPLVPPRTAKSWFSFRDWPGILGQVRDPGTSILRHLLVQYAAIEHDEYDEYAHVIVIITRNSGACLNSVTSRKIQVYKCNQMYINTYKYCKYHLKKSNSKPQASHNSWPRNSSASASRCRWWAAWCSPPAARCGFSKESLSKVLVLCMSHRIGWWENLKENPIFHGKNHGFL